MSNLRSIFTLLIQLIFFTRENTIKRKITQQQLNGTCAQWHHPHAQQWPYWSTERKCTRTQRASLLLLTAFSEAPNVIQQFKRLKQAKF